MSDYPAVTEPTADPEVLRRSVAELKEAVELLTGQRGARERSLEGRVALLEQDLEAVLARLRALE